MRITPTLTPFLFLTASLTAACLTGDDELDLSSVEEDVSGGTIVASAASVGAVQLTYSGGGFYCSGTMVTPDWVLTAAHCNPQPNDLVRLGNNNDPAAQVSAIDRVVGNPAMDLMLVRLKKAFDVQNRGPHYRLSMFSDPTKTLWGKIARFYGSSDDPRCGAGNCGAGFLRVALVNINLWGSHNLGGSGLNGTAAVPGDSGGGLIYETAAGRELAGVNKAGFASGLVRPDAFRQWAISTIYDRPVDLPDIWNFGADSGHFFAVPLQDGYDASHTWIPCAGNGSYTYAVGAELESGYDTLTVTSSAGARTFTGVVNATATASGPLTLTLHSDSSVRSKGITRFTVTCNRGLQFPNPWGVPSPAGTNDLEHWDPCPGGAPWTWTANHSFGSGGQGMIGSRVITGTGTTTGSATGETFVASNTPTSNTDGFRSITARCELALKCHGNTCFSRGDVTTVARTATTTWNPCNGGGFRYKATLELGGSSFFRVNGGTTSEYYQVNGSYNGTSAWRSAGGTVNLTYAASSPSSVGGVKELVAQCDAWGADRTSAIQIQSATYGRNCRVNKDNVTQKVWESCRAQGGKRCDYVVNTSLLGDPAVNCAKDFTVEWTCGTSTALQRLVLGGEANGRTALMTCP